jgi:hypothetical protein
VCLLTSARHLVAILGPLHALEELTRAVDGVVGPTKVANGLVCLLL